MGAFSPACPSDYLRAGRYVCLPLLARLGLRGVVVAVGEVVVVRYLELVPGGVRAGLAAPVQGERVGLVVQDLVVAEVRIPLHETCESENRVSGQ